MRAGTSSVGVAIALLAGGVGFAAGALALSLPPNDPERLLGTAAADSLRGTDGRDFIHAKSGNDSVQAGGDNDIVNGGTGDDVVLGQAGHDVLVGERGADRLIGGWGADELRGGPGYDVLLGGPSDDRISDGSRGSDRIDAGPGDDTIASAPRGLDLVRCGPGEDAVTADASDIVAPDCESIRRVGRGSDAPSERVYSLDDELVGYSKARVLQLVVPSATSPTGSGPAVPTGRWYLLAAGEGSVYFGVRVRRGGYCFTTVSPGLGSGICNDGGRARLIPRRITGSVHRWFAFTPLGYRTLSIGQRTVPIRQGMASFIGNRPLGTAIARGPGRAPLQIPDPHRAR